MQYKLVHLTFLISSKKFLLLCQCSSSCFVCVSFCLKLNYLMYALIVTHSDILQVPAHLFDVDAAVKSHPATSEKPAIA